MRGLPDGTSDMGSRLIREFITQRKCQERVKISGGKDQGHPWAKPQTLKTNVKVLIGYDSLGYSHFFSLAAINRKPCEKRLGSEDMRFVERPSHSMKREMEVSPGVRVHKTHPRGMALRKGFQPFKKFLWIAFFEHSQKFFGLAKGQEFSPPPFCLFHNGGDEPSEGKGIDAYAVTMALNLKEGIRIAYATKGAQGDDFFNLRSA